MGFIRPGCGRALIDGPFNAVGDFAQSGVATDIVAA